ncbi:MAG: hypothetical protein ACLFQQ_18455, partial [Desulfococcaceae bacterium]
AAFAGDGKGCDWTASGEKMHKDWKSDGLSAYNAPMGDMDQDGDAAISWDEFQTRLPNTERAVFDAIDSDGGGDIDEAEWRAFKKSHGMKGGQYAKQGEKAHGGYTAHDKKDRYHQTALPDPDGFMAKLDTLDADGDGGVTWREFRNQFPDADREVYDAMDLDGDGTVGAAEWRRFREAHGKS